VLDCKTIAREEVETMQVYIGLQPIASLIAGILILMIPRLLNYIVAIYLIVIGILGLVKL
jgi:hypothetical protein